MTLHQYTVMVKKEQAELRESMRYVTQLVQCFVLQLYVVYGICTLFNLFIL